MLMLWSIIVGVTCTVPCALLGCYLVLRRLSLLGDAISHGVLPGIVLAVLVSGQITGWPVVLGAMAFGLLTAVLTQLVVQVGNVPEDAGMGVVFTGLFALGVVLISQINFRADLDTGCVLYGLFEAIPINTFPLLGLEVPRAFPTMLAVLVLTLGFLALLWKELQLTSFDEGLAAALGFPAGVVHYLLMAMVAGVTVTAFEAVGSVLVIAMLIVPGATAHLLTDRLDRMLLWAAAVAAVSTVLGVVLAGPDYLDTNAPGMMAVAAGTLFTLAVFFAPRHGLTVRLLRTTRLRLRIVAEDVLGVLYKAEEAASRGDHAAATRLGQEARKAARGPGGWLAWRVLVHRRLVRAGTGPLALTDAGRHRAETIVRAHRLWEKYLDTHFHLPADHLHDPAERMEHFLDADLQRELAVELHQPATDPHGRSIPPG